HRDLVALAGPGDPGTHPGHGAHVQRVLIVQDHRVNDARPGLRPGPHQGALPLGTPPRAAALGTRPLVAVRAGGPGGKAPWRVSGRSPDLASSTRWPFAPGAGRAWLD